MNFVQSRSNPTNLTLWIPIGFQWHGIFLLSTDYLYVTSPLSPDFAIKTLNALISRFFNNYSIILRKSGTIELLPTGNAQGSYYLLSLHSRKRIVHNNWTVLPMPAEVIATVHQLAKACKKYKGIIFTDRHRNIIDDTLTSDQNVDTDDTNEDASDITGVYDNKIYDNNNITGVHNKITGVHNKTDSNRNRKWKNWCHGQQSSEVIMAKPHVHVMMMQMHI